MADRRRPRVLVASGPVGRLDPVAASVALARGFAARSDVAVIGLAESGPALATVLAGRDGELERLSTGWLARSVDMLVVGLHQSPSPFRPPLTGSSVELGRLLAYALAGPGAGQVVVDLCVDPGHDSGAGLLAALGATGDVALDAGWEPLAGVTRVDLEPARRLLAGRQLVGVVPSGQATDQLLGLRGITARQGRAAAVPTDRMLAADAALERFARLVAPTQARADGAGGAGGLGFALLALGGTLTTGAALTADAAGLDRTLARADLVLTACDSFDFGSRGGGVVAELARRCTEAEVPLVVVAPVLGMSGREMRVLGVESAHVLEAGPDPAAALTATAARLAAGWTSRW